MRNSSISTNTTIFNAPILLNAPVLLNATVLNTIWYSKVLVEISLLINTYYDDSKNPIYDIENVKLSNTLIIILIAFLNIARAILNTWIADDFRIEDKIEYYRNIIEIERTLTDVSVGDIKELSVGNIDSYKKRINSVILFGMLCDDPEINRLSPIEDVYFNDNSEINQSVLNQLTSHVKNSVTSQLTSEEKSQLSSHVTNEQKSQLTTHVKSELPTQQKSQLPTQQKSQLPTQQKSQLPTQQRIKQLERMIMERNLKITSSNTTNPLLFSNITNNLESSVSFYYFNECIRQVNLERANLVFFIENTQSLMKSLNMILWILFMAMSLVVYNITFLILVSPLISGLYVFISLMIKHPYDIGDRVQIEDDNLIVKDVGLMSTTFERWNNERVISSNRILKDSMIKNAMRSKGQSMSLDLLVNRTDEEKVHQIDYNIPGLYSVITVTDEIVDGNFIKVKFIAKHEINHQNGYYKWLVQNRFVRRVLEMIRERKIRYIPQEITI